MVRNYANILNDLNAQLILQLAIGAIMIWAMSDLRSAHKNMFLTKQLFSFSFLLTIFLGA